MRRDTKAFIKAYDLLTTGMRLAYMDCAGLLELDTSIPGEEDLTEFALKLSKNFPAYLDENPCSNWDEYIETRIEKKYGRKYR